jgi:hypothetical protein
MIDVRVRQDHRIDTPRVIGKVQVALIRVCPPALIQSAIQQETVAVDLQ